MLIGAMLFGPIVVCCPVFGSWPMTKLLLPAKTVKDVFSNVLLSEWRIISNISTSPSRKRGCQSAISLDQAGTELRRGRGKLSGEREI